MRGNVTAMTMLTATAVINAISTDFVSPHAVPLTASNDVRVLIL